MKKLLLLIALTLSFVAQAFAEEAPASCHLHVQEKILVNASADIVWNQVSDFADLTWFPGVARVEVLEPKEFKVGATRLVYIVDGQTVLTETIHAIKPGETVVMEITDGLPFSEYYVQFTVTPVSASESEVSITAEGVSYPMQTEEFEGFKTHVGELYKEALKNLKNKIENPDNNSDQEEAA